MKGLLMKGSAGRILMIVENDFREDPRVKNESDLLREAGYSITVIALRKKNEKLSEVVDEVQIYRIPQLNLFKKTQKENPTGLQRLWLMVKAFLGIRGNTSILQVLVMS